MPSWKALGQSRASAPHTRRCPGVGHHDLPTRTTLLIHLTDGPWRGVEEYLRVHQGKDLGNVGANEGGAVLVGRGRPRTRAAYYAPIGYSVMMTGYHISL